MRHDDAIQRSKHDETPSSLNKLRKFRDKAKTKTKRTLHIDPSGDENAERSSYEAALDELNDSPAFNSSKFLNQARIGPSGYAGKIVAMVRGTANAIINPKAAIKLRATQTTAGKLAKSHPYLSRKADLEFLEAHDDLRRVENNHSESNDEETVIRRQENIDQGRERVEELEKRRQNMRVAWVTARHVWRVRVVDTTPTPFPDDSFFEEKDDCGFTEFKWGKWIAYKLLQKSHKFTAQYIDDFDELPFDFDTLRKHIERLIIVSAPLQTFISDVRRIYRWENPARTARWMALYFVVWYFSYIVTFFYAYVLYSVAMNYYYSSSLEELRDGIERSIDRGAKAFKVAELMDKHGSKDWLGPLLEDLGPFIQVQVVDFANFLEVCSNFYDFRSPRTTIYSLCFFATLFLLSAVGDAEFTMKVFWFIVGFTFFVCWPISSLYPRYRLLVSIFKWTFWDVPTHAEWCFQYLQERAAVVRDAILSGDDDNHYVPTGEDPGPEDILDDHSDSDASFESAHSFAWENKKDILSFGCTYLHTPGRFIISSTSVRFQSSVGAVLPYKSFDRPYGELVEMSKRQTKSSILSSLAKVTTGMDKLELRFRGENSRAGMGDIREKDSAKVVLLENMRGRDKAFNAIIGFSGLRWQQLQQKHTAPKEPENS